MEATQTTALERSRHHFPAIYLTLHSIVIALVFERLIDWLWSVGGLPLPPFAAALIWMQVSVYVVAAFFIWLHTSLFASSVTTTLKTRDAASPFLLLFLFNGMLASMDDQRTHWWFYLTALVYLAAYPAWRSWEQAHESDPGSPVGQGVYRLASYFHLTAGGVFLTAGLLTQLQLLGPDGAAMLGLVGFVGALAGALLWINGWRRAVGMTLEGVAE